MKKTYDPADESEGLRRSLDGYLFSHRRGIWDDLLSTLRAARSYRFGQRLLRQARRIRAVALLLRVVGWLFGVLQTGTLVILGTAVIFVLLPLALLFLLGVFLTALADSRRSLSRLSALISDRHIYVFFCVHDGFGAENARDFSKRIGSAVLVVSPYWISPRGLGSSRWYVNMRRDGENLFLIRRYLYFRVRKKLLRSDRTTLIY